MNGSMQDGFNLAWKLGHVLEGRSPESLLSTYSAERQVVAKNLIDFDKEWSTMMAKKPEAMVHRSKTRPSFMVKPWTGADHEGCKKHGRQRLSKHRSRRRSWLWK